ncbi:RcnB family protein [Entomohabitans teleogrylli]|uniref:RcnB family protein n=1 Tax=Entomohabitans teleogrylli TaxID=1384589 RepID=UPI00073D99DE|nr:RcnB family protein [Entomohabitans teleogrylli]
MDKLKVSGLALLILSVSGGFTTSARAEGALAHPKKATADKSYDVQEFSANFKNFRLGDTVPDIYRSQPYEIKQWQIRNLPAPEANSHWTYMGGYYVLIADADGKVLRAVTGDIFY